MSSLMSFPKLVQTRKSAPFNLTVFKDRSFLQAPGTPTQCCAVPGGVLPCCANEVKRNRAFQSSKLFKKKLR